jgi:hypothetical protein
MEEEGYPAHFFSESKTITVVAAETATSTPPAATKTPKPSTTRTPEPSATKTPAASPTATPVPTPTPVPTGWAKALSDVNAMADGGTATVAQPESAQLPADLLAALRAKGGTLTVDFGAYACSIDGTALGELPPGLAALDLTMSMEKDAALSEAAGGADVYQLHFAYSGELPGPITVSFIAADHNPGDTLYLYYYYAASGATEVRQSATVGTDGRVSFVIYHCSAYFVTVDANAFGDPDGRQRCGGCLGRGGRRGRLFADGAAADGGRRADRGRRRGFARTAAARSEKEDAFEGRPKEYGPVTRQAGTA